MTTPLAGSPAVTRDLLARLRLPVVGAPMFIVSTPRLVIAQCKAGIVGSMPALNARPRELLDEWICEIKEALAAHDRDHPESPAAPFAINQIAHRTNDRLDHDMEVIARHKVPLVIVSLAAPVDVLSAVHAYGGLVFNDVVSRRHAVRCAEAGVDGLIAVACGAGGHTGTVSPFALVEEIRAVWQGPLGLGGAIGTGRGVAAARVMGADFAYVGTRFIATTEAAAAPEYRDMVVASTSDDIVTSDRLTGVKANFMRQSLEQRGLDPAAMAEAIAGPRSFGETGTGQKAWRDVWSAGHGVGAIQSVAPVAEVVATMSRDYAAAMDLQANHI